MTFNLLLFLLGVGAGFLFGFLFGGILALACELRDGGAWAIGFNEGYDLKTKIEQKGE